jgi:8-oxo-dGTP diphosphatase
MLAGVSCFQQRDDVPGILHPGKVGLFGGHREGNETYLQCVVREIHEKLSYFLPPDRFEHLTSYEGIEFEADNGGTLRGEFYVARDVPSDALIVTEGSLLIVQRDTLSTVNYNFTPAAQFVLDAFLDKKSRRENERRGI